MSDLVQIEDSVELLSLVCPRTGIPVWSIMRIAFFREIMRDLLYTQGSANLAAKAAMGQATLALGRTALHNLRAMATSKLRSNILISTDSRGDTLRNGRWYNRYGDPFGCLSSSKAVVLADLSEWQLREPRYNDRIIYHAPLQVTATLTARLPDRSARALATAAFGIACRRAERLIGWHMNEDRRAAFLIWTARKIAGLGLRYRNYTRLMRRVQPKLLLALGGCYGAHAPLLAAARDLGVATGEFQHGAVSAGHSAYNFADSVFSSDAYRRTLPQFFLTYGTWWNDQITAPVQCVAIGNPTRAEKIAEMVSNKTIASEILILADGVEFAAYLELAKAVARAVSGTGAKVVLRPHPLERSQVIRQFGDRVGDVGIDHRPEIYESFRAANTVVSEVSTGLFEAVGLVDRVIMLDTAKSKFAFPNHPFAVANSTDEVIERVLGSKPSSPSVQAADLWAQDWRANYAWFLRHKVGIEP